MIPQSEFDRFALVLTEALALGAQERQLRAYRILQAELEQACASRAPYKEQLVDLWRRGMQEFKQRYPSDWYSDP